MRNNIAKGWCFGDRAEDREWYKGGHYAFECNGYSKSGKKEWEGDPPEAMLEMDTVRLEKCHLCSDC